MKLSYSNSIFGDDKRHTINAEITTDHPASSYGQPVIVLEDGGALDLMSWTALDYRVEEATKDEIDKLNKIFEKINTKA